MTVIHVIEPFASGVTTAIINITRYIPEADHIVVHGSRMWVDSIENVRAKFPAAVRFISWAHAGREIAPISDFRALLNLVGILRPYRHSAVVHLHSSKAGFIGRVACRILGIKRIIYTPHCAAFIRTDISEKKQRFYRSLEKTAGKLGGLVVGCGETEAKLYEELGLNSRCVSNGVEPGPPSKTAKKIKKNKIVVFVGIANEQKNPEMFTSIASAFQDDKSVRFLWVGDGPLRADLNEEMMEVTGWKQKDEVIGYLEHSLIYLSTSGGEGLPYGVLEAMKSSCALLLNDVPGNRDLVVEGENGFLFDDTEKAIKKLSQMLADDEACLTMGKNSYRMIEENFNVQNMSGGYRKIYQSLLES